MSPSLLLSLVLASIYGLFFHSMAGRRLWQLPCFLLSAILGFFGGEIVAVLAGAELFRVGSVPLIASTVGAFFGLLVCWFFTSPLPEPRTRRRLARR